MAAVAVCLFVSLFVCIFAEIVLRRHRPAHGIFKIGPVELSKREALFPFPPKGRTNGRDRLTVLRVEILHETL